MGRGVGISNRENKYGRREGEEGEMGVKLKKGRNKE